jgi:hypothetical protein
MKIGDLVRYRSGAAYAAHREWLGLIVREIGGTDKMKIIEWTHTNKGTDRGQYRERDLELVNGLPSR